MNPKIFLAFALVLAFQWKLSAQTQKWFTYTDGSPVSDVREHNGTYWASTYGGLVYFTDPNEVYHLDQSNSPINTNKFTCMDMDANGGIWLGTAGGDIYSFINGKWSFYSDEESRKHSVLRVSDIVVDHNNEIWFTRRYMDPPKEKSKKSGITARAYGEDYELVKLKGTAFKRQKVKASTVYSMSLGKDNSLLLATNQGIKLFNGKSKDVEGPKDLKTDQPFNVFQDSKGKYWVSAGRSTWKRKANGEWVIQEIYEAEDGRKFSIAAEKFHLGKEGQVVIGASGEMFTKTPEGWKRYDRDILKTQFGKNVNLEWTYNTQQGEMFAITRFGLMWLKEDGPITINTSNSILKGSNIQKVMIDENHVIHVQGEGKFYEIDNDKWTMEYSNSQVWSPIFRELTEIDQNKLNDFIRNQLKTYFSRITRASDGTIWVPTAKGLVEFKDGTIRVFSRSNTDLPTNNTMAVEQAPDGALWIGLDSGVVEWKDGAMTYHLLESRYRSARHNTIAFGPEGRVYVGGIDGFHVYDGNSWKHIKEGLHKNKTINDLVVDMNGTLWLGTYGSGILRYDGKKLKNITTEGTGLASNTIFSMDLDQYNNIWLGTYEGLCVFNESGLVGQVATDGSSPYYQIQKNSPYSVSTEIENENSSNVELDFKKTKELFTQVKVYPNPTSGRFTIELESTSDSESEYQLLDINGRLIQTKKVSGNRQSVNMDISSQSAGVYLLRIKQGGVVVSERVIKR